MRIFIVFVGLLSSWFAQAQTYGLAFNDQPIIAFYDAAKAVADGQSQTISKQVQASFRRAAKSAQTLAAASQGEITLKFNGLWYDGIVVDPKKQDIRMHWLEADGKTPHKSLRSVKAELEKEGQKVLMLTNAGMYLKDHSPQGLYIEQGKVLRPIDSTDNSYGNFYMKPNGIFYIDSAGGYVCTTPDFSKRFKNEYNSIRYATQSGPMLVINGAIHPRFMHQSKNLHLRSGVGVMPNGKIVFLISRSNETNFHDFAVIFKDLFGCQNALYLDGAISRMYLPETRPNELGGGFGAIVSVIGKQ